MYLGSGIAPITRLAADGLTIGLATDGSGSNNCQDMLETLKFSALLQKVGRMDPSCVLAQRALDWATRGGAEALGMADQVGALAPGMKADFFLANPFTPKAIPVHDPVATLVYSAGAGQRRDGGGRRAGADGGRRLHTPGRGEAAARCAARRAESGPTRRHRKTAGSSRKVATRVGQKSSASQTYATMLQLHQVC
jgi:cytosine/adenosine deaminase-related metal-dependent hydrolase